MKYIYSEGELVGEMYFIKEVPSTTHYRRALFRCKCGGEKEAIIDSVKHFHTNSCGCAYGKAQKIKYEVGEKIGSMIFVRDAVSKRRESRAILKCRCGKEKEYAISIVKSGMTQSCGCIRGLKKTIQYIKGEKVGNMWFIKEVESKKRGRRALFKCVCGKEHEADISAVRTMNTKSCGCVPNTANTRHGDAKSNNKTSPEYRAWMHIKSRCLNKNVYNYNDYGGRGITMCDRWLNSYENFLEDMGRKPSKQHSIDRIDNNGNYEPSNCRWATNTEQGRNKRNTIFLTIDGIEKPAMEWAEIYGIRKKLVWERLKKGWDHKDVIFRKLNQHK